MDSSTKQRLIGVVVLIALATVVLPVLFHHSNKNELALSVPQDAPPPPTLPEVQIAPPTSSTPQSNVVSSNEEQNVQPEITTDQPALTDAKPETKVVNEETSAINARKAEENITKQEIVDTAPPKPKVTQPVINTSMNPPVSMKSHSVHVTTTVKPLPLRMLTKTAVKPAVLPAKTVAVNHQPVSAPLNAIHEKALGDTPWLIQVGSFSNKSNADLLVAKLNKEGYKAFSKTLDQVHTKVFIGPELNRETADKITQKLASSLQIKGLVVKQSA